MTSPHEKRRPAGRPSAEQTTAKGSGHTVSLGEDDLAQRRERIAAYKARAARPDPAVAEQLRRRRDAALRLPPLDEGTTDPLDVLGVAS